MLSLLRTYTQVIYNRKGGVVGKTPLKFGRLGRVVSLVTSQEGRGSKSSRFTRRH